MPVASDVVAYSFRFDQVLSSFTLVTNVCAAVVAADEDRAHQKPNALVPALNAELSWGTKERVLRTQNQVLHSVLEARLRIDAWLVKSTALLVF